ncbi:methylated-DNA--[protein]-cysteine S-methyltransferase [Sphingomonadaceae bacterium OTU29LAMAA1]|uniref:methylated-DNA--[protein]-cysteine S-methyltransferase n=1 Tax=Sphingomonas sp. Leaf37 TaxID=2876552 RepID=UPI001E53DDE0|nr:methylated-DNA--[protein]-cysteine S-methyltransferase [Sphingomonas sp. Leaf37]USU06674.1 methylated-DNA--[protein]-cysteine S-methyltransferase [Sphingomonadaceae bacterium OTU29LAMAA1]
MTLSSATIESPVGLLTLVASDVGLVAVLWEDDDPLRVRLGPLAPDDAHPVLMETMRQLRGYFAGEVTTFDLPLDMRGTDFQKSVWAALLAIPYGETRSYGAIAREIGRPGASRAVGAANGRNPLSIVAPCHRVVGTGGHLTGFAGGLEAKAALLALERRAGELPL